MIMDPIKEALTFDDVTLAPRYSAILPSEVDTSIYISNNLKLEIPLLSSAMDTVTESKMAITIAKVGGLGVIHRNLDIKKQISEIRKVKSKNLLVGAAVGAGPSETKRAIAVLKENIDLIVVDTAHGHTKKVADIVKKIKKIKKKNKLTFQSFQDTILNLQKYWSKQGCAILQPYDMEVGAGTFHPATTLKSLGPKPWKTAYVQPSRRPTDGRYGENPNRLQHYYQFQVLIKPSLDNIKKLFLNSLSAIGIKHEEHDIRFVEDDWESPTLGAAGLGWEVWCDGMEVTQFTYFQKMAGMECNPVSVEITYGLERLCMFIQNKKNVFELNWNDQGVLYKDVFHQSEKEFSAYNFEYANTDNLLKIFEMLEEEAKSLTEKKLSLPAYDQCLKASHVFNILDSRGVIGVAQRAEYIARIRELTKMIGKVWVDSQI